jgi:SAM-dependent methyltransferase
MEASAQVDPVSYKEAQRDLWDASAPVWEGRRAELETWFAPLNARLLDDADVAPGKRVLDLGTGYGEPALSAAARVGAAGEVVGVDISPAMLEVARRHADGLANVGFVLGDVEATALPGGFDAAISRLGLMFVLDKVATFAAIRSALVPGGRLAVAVWGPAERHLISQGFVPLVATLDLPTPAHDAPTPFCMADRDRLAATLAEAGFVDVAIEEIVVPASFASVEDYIRFNQEALPDSMLDGVAARYGSADAPEAWALVAEQVRPHVQDDGSLALPSVALCARAANPLC